MRTHRYLVCGLGLLVAVAVDAADTDPFAAVNDQEFDYREELETPWIESEVQVDSLPEDSNLKWLELEALSPGLRLYADLVNLQADRKEGVTRTWLVLRSEKGAYNGSYEGFRCATGEYKVYAYANPTRSQPLRVINLPRWREVREKSYRDELMRVYLCKNSSPRSAAQVQAESQREAGSYVAPFLR